MAIKVLANTITLASANDVFDATSVRITNDDTARTIVIANTGDPDTNQLNWHGKYTGGQVSIRMNPNSTITVRKRPKDTVSTTSGAGVYADKVAEAGT